ncbi:hypothetical protein [Halopiger xanaduensis]|uniref:Uncharacterized protein n=1 Tax=Halopiger xanaduensis (strain DSM 18323 / JCM 14033 / SH-6) TaxID=797210 RepID=F8D5Z6_HALXS|nr:hypothetical protein [Halopiger xanaduensis]AEH37725.1 hypothetical protein Halxa_3111 [Halopiger xanaduensis SH-6]
MLEWFGGVSNVVSLAIPLFGLGLLLLLTKITDTNRSRRYIVPAFCCWGGFHLVLALYEGTLVPVPRLLGVGLAVALLFGFLALFCHGLYEIWRLQDSSGFFWL